MKKLFNYILLVIALTFTSCDLLDLSPEDSYAEGNFWKNESQVKGVMSDIHNQLRSNATTFFVLGEQRGGLFLTAGSTPMSISNVNLISHNLKESSPGYTNWAGFYNSLIQINLMIYKLESGLPFLSKEKTDYLLGQAHGIRAFYYFYLLRTWGGVPLILEAKIATGVTDPSQLQTARSTEAEVLSFLKEEIALSESKFSADNFTIEPKRDFWSKAATLMLKAEIHLWAAKVKIGNQAPTSKDDDLTKAMNALTAVKNAGKFELLSNFSDVFTYGNKGNKEIIMAIHFEKGESEQNIRQFLYDIPTMKNFYDVDGKPFNDPINVGDRTTLANEYSWDLFSSYADNDTRKYFTFKDFYSEDKKIHGVTLFKFLGVVDNNIRSYSDDWPIYRYADLLLMIAEIKNMQGMDPSIEINQIRQRACKAGYDVYTNKSFAENELAILAERDKEFVREGKRWFDVRRMLDASGKPLAFTLSGLKEAEAYKLLWPVDTGTMTQDPLITQTPGYSGTN